MGRVHKFKHIDKGDFIDTRTAMSVTWKELDLKRHAKLILVIRRHRRVRSTKWGWSGPRQWIV